MSVSLTDYRFFIVCIVFKTFCVIKGFFSLTSIIKMYVMISIHTHTRARTKTIFLNGQYISSVNEVGKR